MPNYSYFCSTCNTIIEKFFYINKYKARIKCEHCKKLCERHYQTDVLSQATSIKKTDTELKTIGDLANRNRDRMSEDQRIALDKKHNEYKDQELAKELPKGMSRIKKPNKVKWR